MAVKNCTLPWTWLVFDANGSAMPCCQARGAVGNLRDRSPDELWNGREIRQVRRALQRGEVPDTCAGAMCSFVQAQIGNAPAMTALPPELDDEFALAFDEQWYLERHPDVAPIVARRQLESGLDHYVHHGRHEGREYRLRTEPSTTWASPHARALVDFTDRRSLVSVGPRDLVIGVTSVCNLRCVMCPHGVGAIDDPHHLDISYAEKLRPFIVQASRVELVGIGEPMLAPLFWRIVEIAREHPHVFLRSNSNAHFLHAQNIERLLDSPFSELSISMDAATPETYRKIRGSDLQRVRDNVRALCRRRRERGNTRLEVTNNFILMRENMHEVVAFAEQAASLGADTVVYSQLTPMPGADTWTVQRPEWRFDYTAQMVPADDPEARDLLLAARERCIELGLKSQFILGTAERIFPYAATGPAPAPGLTVRAG
jgi:MoaA/NifB/PqqE/SkfB family radical SAM enzyme